MKLAVVSHAAHVSDTRRGRRKHVFDHADMKSLHNLDLFLSLRMPRPSSSVCADRQTQAPHERAFLTAGIWSSLTWLCSHAWAENNHYSGTARGRRPVLPLLTEWALHALLLIKTQETAAVFSPRSSISLPLPLGVLRNASQLDSFDFFHVLKQSPVRARIITKSLSEHSQLSHRNRCRIEVKEQSVWVNREQDQVTFPHASLNCLRILLAALDINCLQLRALKSTSANVGLTSRDKFSQLNKHVTLTRQDFVMNPCQWLADRNLVVREAIPNSAL